MSKTPPTTQFLVLMLATLVLQASPASARDRYTVRVAEDLASVEVRACFDGQPPPYLYRHKDAARYTETFSIDGETATASGRRVSLRGAPANACASWQVNLADAARAGDYRTALALEDAVVTAGSLWFWRDSRQRDIEVAMHLPDGLQFSGPWAPAGETAGARRYRPAATPASWSSRLVLGRFATATLDLPGGQVHLAMPGKLDAAAQSRIKQWIAEPAHAVVAVLGQLPQPQVQVLVIGIGPRSSPVPWAHVLRGGGMAIELFADESSTLEEFRADWTATHEFSHLLLPYVAPEDRWLSEGLASYYQNVLRARDGRLSEQEAWQKLVNGFRRGQKDSRDANRGGGTMDTYWRGASLLLQADSRLRALSGGKQSLDGALVALAGCCPDPGKRWPARELLQQLDRLTGYRVFMDAYAGMAGTTAFPDPSETLQKLGVKDQRNTVQLDDTAAWSDIRQDIMSATGQGVVAAGAQPAR